MTKYRVLPKGGRIGKARQIGAVEIDVDSPSPSKLEEAITQAFKKSLPRRSDVVVVGEDRAVVEIGNQTIADLRLYRIGEDDA